MRPIRRALSYLVFVLVHTDSFAAVVDPKLLDSCPGYKATDVQTRPNGLTAQLVLGEKPCNVFGDDIYRLSLNVVYETDDRIHVKISDASFPRYEVPESVFPRPQSKGITTSETAVIAFNYTTSPFSFSIYRKSTQEVLFSTSSHPIVFEPQYIRVKTSIPAHANIYGLGEHTQPFHLPTSDTTLTLWSRDAYGIPTGTNLYGNHPIYFEHRTTGTHGVFLLNSNAMDIKITDGEPGGPALEYNVIGGVLDFYFLAGSETDPTEVARQYAEIAGKPAEVPYWSFGFHQCRFGYKNFVEVADVISEYAAAKIPLETMWTDIDYMDRRRTFTVDPHYFPMSRMREIVSYLHAHDQKFVLMTDPAIAFLPSSGYGPYERGHMLGVFLKEKNGSESLGVVWPGVTVFPDWFHPTVQDFWNKEFQLFYNPVTGLDIDAVWIDMNEPANFCNLPCDDPFQQAIEQHMPPARDSSPPDPNTPIFLANSSSYDAKRDLSNSPFDIHVASCSLYNDDLSPQADAPPLPATTRRGIVPLMAESDNQRELLNPPYAVNNAAGALSSRTAFTDIIHANGLTEYDTHNLFGLMMSTATRNAMLTRRPGKRTLIITRSTFAGAGAHVQKWLGDNFSTWEHYRSSIANMLGFASIYQVPMVGSDICGFAQNTTENLCARWATLGAFYPFMRNHNDIASISQEFYIWPTVAQAARNALDIRYRLLDYIYTAFHQASVDGTPVLHPMWFKYPKDPNTFAIDHQFFFGDSILVSPVTQENAISVSIYLPKDTFYDFKTLAPIEGAGSVVTLNNVDLTQIPIHIKGGVVLPLRVESAMTTTALRMKDFELIVAPNSVGEASGQLYADDGESLLPSLSTLATFKFNDRKFVVSGQFDYPSEVKISRLRILNVQETPRQVYVDQKLTQSYHYDHSSKVLDVTIGRPFTGGFEVHYF